MFYAENLTDKQCIKYHFIAQASIPAQLAQCYKRSPMAKYFYFESKGLHVLSLYDLAYQQWLFSWNIQGQWLWNEHMIEACLSEAKETLLNLNLNEPILLNHLEQCLLVLAADRTREEEN